MTFMDIYSSDIIIRIQYANTLHTILLSYKFHFFMAHQIILQKSGSHDICNTILMWVNCLMTSNGTQVLGPFIAACVFVKTNPTQTQKKHTNTHANRKHRIYKWNINKQNGTDNRTPSSKMHWHKTVCIGKKWFSLLKL